MLYSGFNNLPRSVIWSANSIDRSDNLDVIPLKNTMTNWQQLLQRHFDSDPCDGCRMHLGSPASKGELAEIERHFGCKLPQEFHDLYANCNGYGMVADNKPGEIFWNFRPLNDLQQLSKDVDESFSDTHPSHVNRLITFYDWGTGDSAGYLRDENSPLINGIFDFHHERYGFDETQDFHDFVVPAAKTIAEYLEIQIAECENAG